MHTSRHWVHHHLPLLAVIVLGVAFFGIYSWFYMGSHGIFTSPDEMANYYFIQRFADDSALTMSDPLNQVVSGGIVRPRSTAYANGNTVPGSFVGMIIIYGLLAKLFSIHVVLFFTPFFSVLAAIMFYLFLRDLFGYRMALLSYILLLIMPPFWYYSSRGMFHNALFVALLMMGTYVLFHQLRSRGSSMWYALSGLLIGLSIFVRASEIITVSIVMLSLALVYRKRAQILDAIIFATPLVGVVLVMLLINNTLFGSPLSFSYSQDAVQFSSVSAVSQSLLLKVKQIVLPFGFDMASITHVAKQYLLQIFIIIMLPLWYSLAMLLKGAVESVLQKVNLIKDSSLDKIPRSVRWYIFVFLVLSTWLILYYGSFRFSEYIDSDQILLGSSYLRYWLPIYVFSVPIVVFGVAQMSALFRKVILRKLFIVVISGVLVGSAFIITLNDPLQGLIKLQTDRANNYTLQQNVQFLTEPEAVIISGYADKAIFPVRSVIVRLPDLGREAAQDVQKLQDKVPVYYIYNPLDTTSSQEKKNLETYGYVFQEIYANPQGPEVLYKVL